MPDTIQEHEPKRKGKMMKYFFILVVLGSISIELHAQKYFLSFTDKDNNDFSITQPELFLSPRAIERRNNQNISVKENDLPVTHLYLDSVKKMGMKIYWSSKWLNGVIIESDNTPLIDTITRVSFIQDAKLIWKSNTPKSFQKFSPLQDEYQSNLKSQLEYGLAWEQTATVNGHYLHQTENEGSNMLIAVIDNGFENVDNLPSFEHLWTNNQIKDVVNFVEPNVDVFRNSGTHGMSVLSIMAGYVQGSFKGSAPEASYLLLRTEDNNSEYPIEEYNWVCAAEYADSAGVDVINSSLGYYTFDDAAMNYSYIDMDGQSTICVKGAETAFSKGILVVNSAGNEGANTWKYIITPADGLNVLAIAAMTKDSIRANFSSFGPSADGRVKPDVTALGQQTAIQHPTGIISLGSGTSFSAPVVAGFAACLWQAKPNLTNIELLDNIKKSSHLYDQPNNSFGYGIPDFKVALNINNAVTQPNYDHPFQVYPNPFSQYIHLINTKQPIARARVELYHMSGEKIFIGEYTSLQHIKIDQLQKIPSGVYLLCISSTEKSYTIKLLKK